MARVFTSRKSGLVLRGGAMRRDTQWASLALTSSAITGSNVAIINSAGVTVDALRPYTVVRSRVHLGITTDQQIASEGQLCAWGQCVVSDQAQAIGVSAVPTPITDASSDLWSSWAVMQGDFIFGSAVGFVADSAHTMQVDSKAMRKVEDGQDFITVIEASAASDGLILTSFGRILLKLH